MGTVYNVYGQRRMNEVMEDTWGHLKPKKSTVYVGWIEVAIGSYGDCIIIDWAFDELEASPWQFEHFWANINMWWDEEKPSVGVWRFVGTYKAPLLKGVWDKCKVSMKNT